MINLALLLQKGGLFASSMSSVAVGVSEIQQGEIKKKLSEFMAEMYQLNSASTNLSNDTHALSSQFKELTKEMGKINQESFSAVGAGIEGEIRALLGNV